MAKNNAPTTAPIQYTVGGGTKYPTPVTTALSLPSGEFTQGLVVNSVITGYFPPVYNITGQATAETEHLVRATLAIHIPNSTTVATITINLKGAAIFSSSNSYQAVEPGINNGLSTFPTNWTLDSVKFSWVKTNGKSLNLTIINANTSTSTGTIYVDILLIGS